MRSAQPHFLLFSGVEPTGRPGGRWHFLLESLDGDTVVEASDEEAGLRGERLELLALVRGLEALDQPSRVTLITASRDVRRGIRYGLEEWRANQWCWERDGRWVPIKNRDLWQRIDRALRFHRVDCRRWRLDDQGGELAERDAERLERNPLSSARGVAGVAAQAGVETAVAMSATAANGMAANGMAANGMAANGMAANGIAAAAKPDAATSRGAVVQPAAAMVAGEGWASRGEAAVRQEAADHRSGGTWWQTFARLFRSPESDWTWASAN